MNKMMHEFTEEKLVVLGMNVFDRNEPNVWDTIQFKPKNGTFKMSSGIGDVDDPYNVIGETEDLSGALNEDLDQYAAKMHSKDVGYSVEKYTPNHDDWATRIISYPYRGNKRKR